MEAYWLGKAKPSESAAEICKNYKIKTLLLAALTSQKP